MTAPDVGLTARSSRVLWLWCVAYTAATPREVRHRRRAELRSHLWECEHAGLPSRAVMWAAVRGAFDDIAWTVRCGALGLVRSFTTPTPYVVLAALMPIQAWLVSSFNDSGPAQISQGVGGFGGPAMLLLAGAAWWVQRQRQR
jgi:hypothetical protein